MPKVLKLASGGTLWYTFRHKDGFLVPQHLINTRYGRDPKDQLIQPPNTCSRERERQPDWSFKLRLVRFYAVRHTVCGNKLWVELGPLTIHKLKPQPSVPQNVVLFGNKVTADIIS